MSAYPRQVLTDIYVTWGLPRDLPLFVRRGTVVDVAPGSQLEQAYGGSGNLSGVILASQRGNEQCLSKATLAN